MAEIQHFVTPVVKQVTLSEELLQTCRLLNIRRQGKTNKFLYMGHEVDLSTSGNRAVNVMTTIAQQLAKELTDKYNEETATMFGI